MEHVLLYSPKTLTEAAKYAHFSETAVCVAKNRGAPISASTINLMNYRGNFNKRGLGCGSSNNRGRSVLLKIPTRHRKGPSERTIP